MLPAPMSASKSPPARASSGAAELRLLSWNVRWQGFGARIERVVEAIVAQKPDIVTLQEVPAKNAANVEGRLRDSGLELAYFWQGTLTSNGATVKHGVLIASRWPVKARRRWAKAARYPDLFGRALVAVPDIGDVDVVTAHIPNGSANGWVKVEHLQLLGQALLGAPDLPRILSGDFNEPREFRASGQIVPFGVTPREDGSLSASGNYTKGLPDGEVRQRVDWARAVWGVLSRHAHGLSNVIEARHGLVPMPVTHVVSGSTRCFDHAFVSGHFEVVDAGYHHEWRSPESHLSDHSALWATLRWRR
jgi:endonuclease/exonuclease/phosphatase family metal-dependent hydrolase